MLINDHVLRVVAPSWITGKLSDAAWLVIVAPLVAIIFAPLFPHNEKSVGRIALIVTGAGFVLIKLSPVPVRFGVFGTLNDPTDLLMLPALGVAWFVWRRSEAIRARHVWWIVVPLAALTLMADAPRGQNGVESIGRIDGAIVASGYSYAFDDMYYESTDGGLSWKEVSIPNSVEWSQYGEEIVDPRDSSIRYRFTFESIERSTDSGETWTTAFDFSPEESQFLYSRKVNVQSNAGPRMGLIDLDTGNLVIAMGFQGVLVQTPDGTWHWVAVGPYARHEMTFDERLGLIWGELLLSFLLVGVMITILAVWFPGKRVLSIFLAVIGSLFWALTILVAPASAANVGELGNLVLIITVVSIIVILLVSVGGIYRFIDQGTSVSLRRAALIGAISGILIASVYILWVFTGVIRYQVAMIFALAAALAGIITGFMMLRGLPGEQPTPSSSTNEPKKQSETKQS